LWTTEVTLKDFKSFYSPLPYVAEIDSVRLTLSCKKKIKRCCQAQKFRMVVRFLSQHFFLSLLFFIEKTFSSKIKMVEKFHMVLHNSLQKKNCLDNVLVETATKYI
jgi:hypothetical protein